MLQFVWHRRRLIEKWDEKKKVTSGRKQQGDAALFQKRHAENEKCYVWNNGTLSSRGEKMPQQKQFFHHHASWNVLIFSCWDVAQQYWVKHCSCVS